MSIYPKRDNTQVPVADSIKYLGIKKKRDELSVKFRKLYWMFNRTLYNQLSQIMAYTDDIVILTINKENLIEAIRKLVRAGKDQGLEINECKMKFMIVNEH